jgi:hypothetical protein
MQDPPRRPLALTDEELTAVIYAASPLEPGERSAFLMDVADALARLPNVGPGLLHRVLAEIQRKHFSPAVEIALPGTAVVSAAKLGLRAGGSRLVFEQPAQRSMQLIALHGLVPRLAPRRERAPWRA